MTLHIPDGINELDTLGAALAYAAAGWHILPVQPGTKHPGSVVGDGWPSMSSRDPKQIAAWFAGADYGIALHVGRSGAVVLDVDEPAHVPDEVLAAMETTGCPYQSTRPDRPGRGHYLFANTTGRRISNSLGRLSTKPSWGEVRGANGVVVVAPTPHPDGGLYRWERTGVLPGIPDYVAEALPESATPEDTASDGQVREFLDRHTAASRPEALTGLVNALTAKLAGGASCHMATLGVVTDAVAEAAAGLYPAREALQQLWPVYRATATTGTSTGRRLTEADARAEFNGIVAWAVGQATGEKVEAARQRVGDKYEAAVIEVDPADLAGDGGQAGPQTDREWVDHILDAEGDFWQSRSSLAHIYDAALARMCSPWAVLGHCAARGLYRVPSTVALPALIGGPGSLNAFFVVTARSGGGKSAAEDVARELVDQHVEQRSLGSGEGLLDAFVRPADKETGEPRGYYPAIAFVADESDTVNALAARSGSTLLSTLRTAWSGRTVNFGYRGRSHDTLHAHSYRMTLVVSAQNARAGWLLDDAGGGTPQRFVWLPATDPRISAQRWNGDPVAPLALPSVRDWLYGRRLDVPEQARRDVLDNHERRQQGHGDALDGHALFCRLKVAYALAVLDGRADMTGEDWRLAGIAAEVSARTRAWVQSTVASEAAAEDQRIGAARGRQQVSTEETKADLTRQKCSQAAAWILTKLAAGPMSGRDLNRSASAGRRVWLESALVALKDAGQIRDQAVEGRRGPSGVEWSLCE